MGLGLSAEGLGSFLEEKVFVFVFMCVCVCVCLRVRWWECYSSPVSDVISAMKDRPGRRYACLEVYRKGKILSSCTLYVLCVMF